MVRAAHQIYVSVYLLITHIIVWHLSATKPELQILILRILSYLQAFASSISNYQFFISGLLTSETRLGTNFLQIRLPALADGHVSVDDVLYLGSWEWSGLLSSFTTTCDMDDVMEMWWSILCQRKCNLFLFIILPLSVVFSFPIFLENLFSKNFSSIPLP